MCGIAGYFGSRRIERERVERALQLMVRRGPDDQQHHTWVHPTGRTCSLLHSRLSIIDLDPRSNQPFTVGTKSIVFNGELYNYRELRGELLRDGYHPRTTSDTEVLLAAIDRFGWSVLDRCEGMWAFAVYDAADGSLTVCRDRFGEKPLFLYRDAGGIYFGSEVKFIQALVNRSLDVNIEHIYRFLVDGYRSLYKRAGQTFFQRLDEVPARTLVRFDHAGNETQIKFWEPVCKINPDISYADAVAGARERLIRSVELRLRADTPVAFCMSGGVDSNSLISIAKRVFGYQVHGFTIANTDSRYEEQEIIEKSVAELGIRHTNVSLNASDFLSKLRTLVRYHDAPVYTITSFTSWMLMEAIAARGYRISVSGISADELFTGYYDHHLQYLAEVRGNESLFAAASDGWRRNVKPWVRNPYLSDPDLFVNNPDFRGHIFLNSDRFAERLCRSWREPFTESRYTGGLLRNRMLNELFHEATPVILHEDDLNAMYFSIENRSPFLDRALFEFCYSIPTEHLIRDGFAKVVLRDAMRGIVPDCVLNSSRKVGFNAPIRSMLNMNDSTTRAAMLDNSPIFEHVRRDAIEHVMSMPEIANSESESKFLFNFLSAKLFLEECATLQSSSGSRARINQSMARPVEEAA